MSYLCTHIPFYVYKIICEPTGQYYFGSRYGHSTKGIQPNEDLWKLYFTSSSVIKELITIHGKESFEPTILKLFDRRDQAYWYEQQLIENHINDPLCLNLYYRRFEEGKAIFVYAGVQIWTNVKTGKRLYCEENPGDEWIRGGSHSMGKKLYHREGFHKFFDEDPRHGWVKGRAPLETAISLHYGNSYNKNKRWWNDGIKSIMSHQQPGPDWTEGRLSWCTTVKPDDAKKAKIGDANRARKAYNNGIQTIMRKEHPGPGWAEGPLHKESSCIKRSLAKKGKTSNTKGKHWWNNGHCNKMSVECPGESWVRGKIK